MQTKVLILTPIEEVIRIKKDEDQFKNKYTDLIRNKKRNLLRPIPDLRLYR